MNKQKTRGIDWTQYSFNPISGCLHACPYCYMQRMEKRFPGIMKPTFHPERLSQAKALKKPSLLFTGSSGDMWGEFIPSDWIYSVLNVCLLTQRHTYQFLTKNPKRYAEFTPLENCWYGTTDDGTKRTKNNIRDLVSAVSVPRKFVSFEPLLNAIEPDLTGIQWVIIGADSNRGAKRPPKSWADTIIKLARKRDVPVFVKDNYNYPTRIKEMPTRDSGTGLVVKPCSQAL